MTIEDIAGIRVQAMIGQHDMKGSNEITNFIQVAKPKGKNNQSQVDQTDTHDSYIPSRKELIRKASKHKRRRNIKVRTLQTIYT